MSNVTFASILNPMAIFGMALGGILLIVANITIQNTSTDSALKVLPMFHVVMLIYTTSIILSYFI